MDETLIIIDMQGGFSPIPSHVTSEVIAEVRRFRARRLPIIVVEIVGMGRTISVVERAVGRYHLARYVTKEGHNGAGLVRPTLANLGFPHIRSARVCGLYTSICVAETAEDLAYTDGFDVTVVARACFDEDDAHGSQLETWRMGYRHSVSVG